MSHDMDAIDVLVVGAGACGLAAAIAAHDAGVSVAIIEKRDRPGGNSSLSTGSVPAAGTRFQRDAGIEDSTQRFVADLERTGGPTDCPELLHRLVATSAETVEWLVDTLGARMALVTAYRHVGHSVPRLHAPVSRRGQDLVDDLLAAAEIRGIPLAVGNGARALVTDDGAVTGADVETGGEQHRIAARKVVLAVNGFAGNRDLVARFCPEVSGAQYFGARGSEGEAVLWGEQLGAALGNIGAYQGYAAVSDPHGSLLSWTTIEKGGIIVNRAGLRFGDESAGYSGYTPNVMAQGAPCFAIFDQRIFDLTAAEEEFVELANHGGVKQADTPQALAALHKLDTATVAAAVDDYNKAARGEQRDAFGRRDFALAPLRGPFYICRIVPGLFHTQGGLMVDIDGRVLRPDGKPIANLFAGGGAAAGLSGKTGAGGYASGNGLLSAVGLGRLAGPRGGARNQTRNQEDTMSFDLVIRGGNVVLPDTDGAAVDIAVSQGRIAAILAPGTAVVARETLDTAGKTVLPGVIDAHLHLGHGKDIARPRVPADADSETAAAALGGVTTFIPYLMATDPFEAIFDEVKEVTEAGARIDFGYHFIISTEAQLAGAPRYAGEFGAPSFKIFMNNRGGEGERLGLPDIDDGFLLRLCEAAAQNGGMVCPHPENIEAAWVLRRRLMAEDPDGRGGLRAWNASRPPFVEADAVQRAGLFARETGARLYIVHTSSREALEAALRARDAGTDIIIETCPHYLTHDVGWEGGDVGKINPPLRERGDCDALWAGIVAGDIDTVATDHVHRDISSKAGGIWKASPGCAGLETLLPVMLTDGHHARGIPLGHIAALLSAAPADVMGLERKGRIAVGRDADFAIVDLAREYDYGRADVRSSAGYSIYEGRRFKGQVVHTLVRGQFVVRDGALADGAVGTGRYIKRTL